MKILVIHDNPSDPVVSLIASQQSLLKQHVTLVSLQLFIEQMQVCDQIDERGVSIQWTLKDQDNSTKCWTNHDTYLLNRCHQFPGTWNHLFHPDDREYARNELTAYLHFAFTAFKYRMQPVSYYGLSGSVMPLFVQWDIVKNRLPDLDVPAYYVGPYGEIPWPKAVMNPDPYDVTYWVAEMVNHHTNKDYVFAYQRPVGQPVLVYITPIGAEVVKDHVFNQESGTEQINEALLKRFATSIGQKLAIRLGEILFFVAPQQVTFGAATPRVIHAQHTPHFQKLTLQALTTPLAYHNPDHPLDSFQHSIVNDNFGVIPSTVGSVIAIGSTKDNTMYNLVASQSFSKNGVLLPLEACNVTWHFSYSNGVLRFFTKDSCLETIAAIYYRPFARQENNALDLLHNCLDSFDGLVYGRGSAQYLNASKPMQLAHVLPVMHAYHAVALPDTTIIKMMDHPAGISEPSGVQYITKSISGVRSIVVNNHVFDRWEQNGLHTLPTLFQKQIEGDDIRVHVCHDQVFAVKITHKDAVDYRYAAAFSIQIITLPKEIIAFCLMVRRLEANPLIGIDFIRTTSGYIFLEANPMPGWDWFYSKNEIVTIKESICDTIMQGDPVHH